LVLFSGGQDSTVCLAWALSRYSHVETVGFDYGQRHRIELDCRKTVLQSLRAKFPAWAAKLGEDHSVDLSALGEISQTSLTREAEFQFAVNGLPNSFVPGRNILFFTFAAAIAYRRDLKRLVGGMCETDYLGYPNCRDDTLKALQVALSLGLDKRLVLDTPLMWIDKAATWELARDLGQRAPLAAQRQGPFGRRGRGRPMQPMGTRAPVAQTGFPLGGIPAQPLRDGLGAHAQRTGDARRAFAKARPPHDLVSTARRRCGILVDVHSGAPGPG
jgi:7-cyano-7-deazaguanine synthase